MKNLTNYITKEFIPYVLHSVRAPHNRMLLLFTLEGALITLVNNLVGNNNNLFATRLGASDFELSLVITLPQLVGMLVLIPGGILTDRMANKRRMVITALTFLTIAYVLIGLVPVFGAYRLQAFLFLLALSSGPMTIYNVSWQAYFSDVVNIETRNSIFTTRTGLTFLIGILIPFGSGALLASVNSVGDKIFIHQIFFWIGSILLLLQIMVLKRIQGEKQQHPAGIGLRQLKTAFLELSHNKRFLGFVGVAMFFYLTWQIDWTLYFVGQVKYLGMNEAWLSYASIGSAVMQFITVGFWGRLNAKRGVRFGIIFGNLGLALFPITMIAATSAPAASGKLLFVIFNTLSNIAMATTSLNIFQCLLQVLPEKNKTLNISIYTVLVTLSNAVMPLVGVALYTAFGANRTALHTVFWIIFVFRLVSSGLWTLRWWRLRNEPT